MSMRYYYFGRPLTGRHQGVITMAVEVDSGYTEAGFAMSFCSPKDQFCKARGRQIAGGRLNKPGLKHTVVLAKDVKPSTAICTYFNDQMDRSVLPQWARDWVLVPDALAAGASIMRHVGVAPGGAFVQDTHA